MPHVHDEQLVESYRTIVAAYAEFGDTYASYDEHSVKTVDIEPNQLVAVPNMVAIQQTEPLSFRSGEMVPYGGKRKLLLTILGQERDRLSSWGTGRETSYTPRLASTWSTTNAERERPVLADVLVTYNTQRVDTVNPTVYDDGREVGIELGSDSRADLKFVTDLMSFLFEQPRIKRFRTATEHLRDLSLKLESSARKSHGRLDRGSFLGRMRQAGYSSEPPRAATSKQLGTIIFSQEQVLAPDNEPTHPVASELSTTTFDDNYDQRFDTSLHVTSFTADEHPDTLVEAIRVQQTVTDLRRLSDDVPVDLYPRTTELTSDNSRLAGRLLRPMRRQAEAYFHYADQIIRTA